MITFLYIIGGLVLLFVGGEVLVRGAVGLAKNLGISTFIIGLTVVAYGTSSPELVISSQAAFEGYADIALGNVIGSNISNILCVIGLTALIYPIAIDKKVSFSDALFMLVVTVLLCVVSAVGVLNWVSGLLFIAIISVYTWFIFKNSKQSGAEEELDEQVNVSLNMPLAIVACIAGFALLIVGANFMIEGAVEAARKVGVSEAAIGVTLVAFGGSVPELATSVMAAIHKRSEIVFGNIIGSNLFNILGILGVSSMIAPIEVNPAFISFDLPVLLGVTVFLVCLMWMRPHISRAVGGLFFLCYLGYVIKQFAGAT